MPTSRQTSRLFIIASVAIAALATTSCKWEDPLDCNWKARCSDDRRAILMESCSDTRVLEQCDEDWLCASEPYLHCAPQCDAVIRCAEDKSGLITAACPGSNHGDYFTPCAEGLRCSDELLKCIPKDCEAVLMCSADGSAVLSKVCDDVSVHEQCESDQICLANPSPKCVEAECKPGPTVCSEDRKALYITECAGDSGFKVVPCAEDTYCSPELLACVSCESVLKCSEDKTGVIEEMCSGEVEVTPCAEGTLCVEELAACVACVPGALQCAVRGEEDEVDVVEICTASGMWELKETCGTGKYCDPTGTASCQNNPPNCGNGILEVGEVCDGRLFAPGFNVCSAYDDTKTWAYGHPGCLACTLTQGNCTEVSSTCGNGILEPGELCEPDLEQHSTPMACLFDSDVLGTNPTFMPDFTAAGVDRFWVGSYRQFCDSTCTPSGGDCQLYPGLIEAGLAAHLFTYLTSAHSTLDRLRQLYISWNFTVEPTFITTDFYSWRFGPWLAGKDGLFSTERYVEIDLSRHAAAYADYDHVAIFFTYLRESSLSPTRFALAIYDGDEFVGVAANFGTTSFKLWKYSGQIVIPTAGISKLKIRFHSYDAGGYLMLKNLVVRGVTITG
ncbi:MAG: hypothetical protein FWC40_01900 [Proteobacteria bacterium]|nr:hypothetical protein [Pseudomonadota bacterium]